MILIAINFNQFHLALLSVMLQSIAYSSVPFYLSLPTRFSVIITSSSCFLQANIPLPFLVPSFWQKEQMGTGTVESQVNKQVVEIKEWVQIYTISNQGVWEYLDYSLEQRESKGFK